jgi:transcriptional regulator with PAS, ATPase and Fis domain
VFDNIIGRQDITRQLTEEIRRSALPSSILIHGERYGGKLSLALEAARCSPASRRGSGAAAAVPAASSGCWCIRIF